jgi:RNA polymerase sigma factor for flagellar operon FliA
MNAASRVDREEVVRRLFPLVRRLATRVSYTVNSAVDLDDLIGDGALGLLRAIDTYDPAYGTSLENYARRLAVGAMLNGLRRIDPISERARRAIRVADRERFERANAEGRLRTFGELERADPKLRRARAAAHMYAIRSLDAPYGSEGGTLADWRDEPSAKAVSSSSRRELQEAIALLPARQRQVVALHYYGELSLHAIGRKIGLSAQRVSQIHLMALAKLRLTVPRT